MRGLFGSGNKTTMTAPYTHREHSGTTCKHYLHVRRQSTRNQPRTTPDLADIHLFVFSLVLTGKWVSCLDRAVPEGGVRLTLETTTSIEGQQEVVCAAWPYQSWTIPRAARMIGEWWRLFRSCPAPARPPTINNYYNWLLSDLCDETLRPFRLIISRRGDGRREKGRKGC